MAADFSGVQFYQNGETMDELVLNRPIVQIIQAIEADVSSGTGGSSNLNSTVANLGLRYSVQNGEDVLIEMVTSSGSNPDALSFVEISFHEAESGLASYTKIAIEELISEILPNEASLGFASTEENIIYVYACYSPLLDEVFLGVTKTPYLEENKVQATILLDASSDDPDVLYSSVVATDVAVRLVGFFTANRATDLWVSISDPSVYIGNIPFSSQFTREFLASETSDEAITLLGAVPSDEIADNLNIVDLGTGESVFSSKTGNTVNLKTVVGDGIVTVSSDTNEITISVDVSAKEDVANKATNLTSPNNTTYPTTQAVATALADVSAGESYQGEWNADTNTPTLTSSTGTEGHYYRVNVAGTTTLDGISVWDLGDEVLFNGTVWVKRPNILPAINTSQVTEDPTNLYFTNARVRSATLTGLSVSSAVITATDTVLSGFGKTQGQINTILSRTITAGNGLTGGGDLSANRTITLGTPSTITTATSNSVSGTTHTHAISITAADIGAVSTTTLNTRLGTTGNLGTIATQNSNNVTITGGVISGITDLAIADGGTGASTAAAARTNLGLGTASVANVTTSATDTTSGRVWRTNDLVKVTSNIDTTSGSVVTVGYAGWGDVNSTAIKDANSINVAAAYQLDIGTPETFSNFPSWAQPSRSTFITTGNKAPYSTDLYFDRTLNRAAFRTWSTSANPWQEFWTTGNLIKTTSSTDTTSGSMLQVGDGGILVPITLTGQNLNLRRPTAFYYAQAPASGPSGNSGWLLQQDISSAYNTQTFVDAVTGNYYHRTLSNSVQFSWRQVWDTGNTSAEVQSMLSQSNYAGVRSVLNVVNKSGDLMSGSLIVQRNPGTSPTYSSAHIELRTTNDDPPLIAFHRQGSTACTLMHTSGGGLVLTGTTFASRAPLEAGAITTTVGFNGVGTNITSLNASNLSTGTVAVARLPAGTTSVAGILRLYNGVDSTSTTLAATANAVKTAYDLAQAALDASSGGSDPSIPQFSASVNLTYQLSHNGQHGYDPNSSHRVHTIPADSTLNFPIGANITLVRTSGFGSISVVPASGVTLRMAGTGATGNAVVGAYGQATLLKVAANTWVINGVGFQ